MITYHKGDLLESGCSIICHQCNIQSVFGGGLALQIKNKYPEIEAFCQSHKVAPRGSYIRFFADKTTEIMNCYTQNINFETVYNEVGICFSKIKNYALETKSKFPVTIGVPYGYGCGIAHGEWEKVLHEFKEIFETEDRIDFQIWKFES